VKACPLCAYKAGIFVLSSSVVLYRLRKQRLTKINMHAFFVGSMKSLRGHFYSRHGIDLDNPMPHSPSMICSSNGRASASPGPNHGEYSELAHALGFEERDKSTDSSMVPSHFLVPQIEISSNSSYPTHFAFTADSSYSYKHDDRKHKGMYKYLLCVVLRHLILSLRSYLYKHLKDYEVLLHLRTFHHNQIPDRTHRTCRQALI